MVLYKRENLDCRLFSFDPALPDPGYVNSPLRLGIWENGERVETIPQFYKYPASQVGVNPFLPLHANQSGM